MTTQSSKRSIVALMFLSLLLAGCVAPGPVALNAPGENRISSSDMVNIGLAAGVAERLDPVEQPFGGKPDTKHPLSTGPIWRRVFIGPADSAAVLEIKSAHYKMSFAAVGWAARFTYDVQAELFYRGKRYPVTAIGSRAAALDQASAMRQAVELAVVDAAHQAAKIVELADATAAK